MYLVLDTELNRGLFIDCLSLIVVNTIKKNLFGFTQTNILTVANRSGWNMALTSEMRAAVST